MKSLALWLILLMPANCACKESSSCAVFGNPGKFLNRSVTLISKPIRSGHFLELKPARDCKVATYRLSINEKSLSEDEKGREFRRHLHQQADVWTNPNCPECLKFKISRFKAIGQILRTVDSFNREDDVSDPNGMPEFTFAIERILYVKVKNRENDSLTEMPIAPSFPLRNFPKELVIPVQAKQL